ncbi:MAG: hypothetical protein M3525_13850 [Acidobacteriota bacterium]|nr:hypothetical protein [Acidobacteriota bacterium]
MKFNQIKNARAQFSRFRKTVFNGSLMVFALLLPVLFVASCSETASERAETVGGVTARQVIENPSAYVGKTVTVSGDVEEIHGPRAFNMDSGLTVGELLVVGREPFPNVPDRGNTAYLVSDIATVTGVVRMLVTADIEREIGWDLDPQLEAEYNAKPVLVAQSITFRPNANRAAATAPANANMNQPMMNTNAGQPMANTMANTNTGQTATGNRITDLGVFASTADKLSLAGREAQFTNARVVRVVGPRTFTVASGNSEIYVMLDDASARAVGTQGKIDAGDTLNLTGEFERLQLEEINDLANARFRPLTEQERAFLKNTQVFLTANQISGLN